MVRPRSGQEASLAVWGPVLGRCSIQIYVNDDRISGACAFCRATCLRKAICGSPDGKGTQQEGQSTQSFLRGGEEPRGSP